MDNRLSEKASVYLDSMRAIAAIFVMISHIRPLFFVTLDKLAHPTLIDKMFYFFTYIGYQSVMVFFVLSGYLISGSVYKSLSNGNWSPKVYLINRLSRLYVVLIPALLLTVLWDVINSQLFQQSPKNDLSVTSFMGNLFYLQQIFVPPLGSNSPLWSLSYEFWYYLMFPILLGIFFSRSKVRKVLEFVLILALFSFLSPAIMVYFVIWLLGFSIHFIPKNLIRTKALQRMSIMILILALFAVCYISIMLGHTDSTLSFVGIALDVVIGVLVALLIYVITTLDGTLNNKFTIARLLKPISNFSYTLYLTHLPLLSFISLVMFGKTERWIPAGKHIFYGIVIALFVILYSYAVYLSTERHTTKIRKYVAHLLTNKQKQLQSMDHVKGGYLCKNGRPFEVDHQ